MNKKYALIIGASGDIGRAIAKKLAGDGYHLYLHYHQNEESIDVLMKELISNPIKIKKIRADLTTDEGYLVVAEEVDQIDVLVFASGVSPYGLITDIPVETVVKQVQHQLTSIYLLIQKILPKLVAKKAGNIVFITSIWGEIGAACEVLYSMVKGGQNTLVKALSQEVAPSGIRVNAVSPGAIETKMLAEFSQEDLDLLVQDIPLKRLGKPQEVAALVSFLLSEEARYITGKIFSINGGWL